MPSITTIVVVVGALPSAVVVGLLGITRVLPRDRDCEVELKLFPPAVRFSVARSRECPRGRR